MQIFQSIDKYFIFFKFSIPFVNIYNAYTDAVTNATVFLDSYYFVEAVEINLRTSTVMSVWELHRIKDVRFTCWIDSSFSVSVLCCSSSFILAIHMVWLSFKFLVNIQLILRVFFINLFIIGPAKKHHWFNYTDKQTCKVKVKMLQVNKEADMN